MKDNDFSLLGLSAIVVLVWFLLASRGRGARQPTLVPSTDGALPVGWDDPMNAVYNANPNAYQPATPASLTLNIANQSAALLNQNYIPLFGFVGMAQGQMYE